MSLALFARLGVPVELVVEFSNQLLHQTSRVTGERQSR
jgi:hypothetical protein